MKLNNKFAQRLVLCAAPLVTGSVLVALPGLSATLANSGSAVNFNNFSHNPESVAAVADTTAYSEIINSGALVTKADAVAAFIPDSSASSTQAFGASLSTVQGEGDNYLGEAKSLAQLVGYNFTVGAGETFSFDFGGLLGLQTSVDYDSEAANAFGAIGFQLYDTTDANAPVPLDFFTISGNLDSTSNNDYVDAFQSSKVTLNQNDGITSFGGKQEVAQSSFMGKLSRFFERATSIALVGFNRNTASSACSIR